MIFDVQEILKTDGACVQLEGELPSSSLFSMPDVTFSRVFFTGNVTNIGGLLELVGTATGAFSVPCARCAKMTEQTFSAEVSETLANASAEVSDREAVISFAGTTVDLGEIIWPEILLGLETRYLCKPDCKGLCFKCGKDLNEGECSCETDEIDPRLAGLKDLLK